MTAILLILLVRAGPVCRAAERQETAKEQKAANGQVSKKQETKNRQEQKKQWTKKMTKQLELEQLDQFTAENLPKKITFSELVKSFIEEKNPDWEKLFRWFLDLFFYEIRSEKSYFMQLLVVTVVLAVFRQLLDGKEKYVVSVSRWMIGVTLTVILMNAFLIIAQTAQSGISALNDYMKMLVPTYAAALTVSGNPASAALYYEFSFLIMAALSIVMKTFLVPGIHIFLLLRLFDQLFEEERLTRLADLTASIIRNVMKYGMAAVMGISCIQGMLGRARDQMNSDLFIQSVSAIPGMGNILGSAGNIFISCGVLVKNSVGIAAVIIMFLICLTPLIKVLIFVLLFRFLAAMLQPVADKHLVNGIFSTAQAGKLYFLLLRDSALMFVLTAAVLTAVR